jgi:Uma2 family endonuclease
MARKQLFFWRISQSAAFLEQAREYRAFGIEEIWILDPAARTAWRATAHGLSLVKGDELIVTDSPIRVLLHEIFAELDRI